MVKKNFKKKVQNYFLKAYKRSNAVKSSAHTSAQEIFESIEDLKSEPSLYQLAFTLKTMLNSTTWVSLSTLRFIASLIEIEKSNKSDLSPSQRKMILKAVCEGEELQEYSEKDIFRAIYDELEYSHHNPAHQNELKIPKLNCTIVLVSGVWNEIFSTAAFERGANYLQEKHNINFITAQVSGRKSSQSNARNLESQLREYISLNPNKKLWLVSFSKGGIDSLHLLKNNPVFASKYILGLSTIASPILGSPNTNNVFIQLINAIENTKIYKTVGSEYDLLQKEMQDSLKTSIRKSWFYRNYKKLPKDIFYSSLALEAEWYESHIWMILTKLMFQSSSRNDGVVDVEFAHFPNYFNAHNLGILKGHHLVGTRSSFYSQEALLEAHIVYLNYKKLIS